MAVVAHNEPDTWPKVLQHNAARFGAKGTAMRYKHYGIWHSYSWEDYLSKVKDLALGLKSLGFGSESRLLIVGDNSPEWFFAQLAAQGNRGVSVGLYSDLSAAEIERIARDSEADFAMVEDEEQADKIAEIRDRLPHLKTVVFWRYKGLGNRDRSVFVGLRDVVSMGRDYEAEHPGAFEESVASGGADDVCSIIYTSGTGVEGPKGTLHSHRSLMANSRAYYELDGLGPKDDLAGYLPPAWIAEQWLTFGCHLLSGGILNFAENSATHEGDVREIAPHFLVYNSRLWESQAGQVQARMRGASRLKRLATGWSMRVGYQMVDMAQQERRAALQWRLLDTIADRIVFRPVRDSLGLSRARVCYTSGSTLSADAIRFFRALKVPIKNIYGSAEAGAVTGAADRIQSTGTVGSVNPGVEVTVAEQDELVVRHPGTFLGYHNDPDRTARVLNDGSVRTGDKVSTGAGNGLVFVDRLDDLITLPCGVVAPQGIESRLRSSPYIKDAWVLAGEGCEALSAVVIVDAATAGRWADQRKVRYTTFADLARTQEVYRLIEDEIASINRDLDGSERIEKFVNLHREFDPDEFELTRDRKLRRAFLTGKYGALIRALAGDDTSVEVEGSTARGGGPAGDIRAALRIATVGREGP
jgi:long-chain acyl-CoA synthetase